MIPTCKSSQAGQGHYIHNEEALKREEERWEEDDD